MVQQISKREFLVEEGSDCMMISRAKYANFGCVLISKFF
jgi:hypothetical protein